MVGGWEAEGGMFSIGGLVFPVAHIVDYGLVFLQYQQQAHTTDLVSSFIRTGKVHSSSQ
jgi:hypothetical protein